MTPDQATVEYPPLTFGQPIALDLRPPQDREALGLLTETTATFAVASRTGC